MEHIDPTCSLEPGLYFGSICSVGILNIFQVITKTSFSKITKCSTLVGDAESPVRIVGFRLIIKIVLDKRKPDCVVVGV